MGRARSKTSFGFTATLGSGRGNPKLADIASARPSAAARAEIERLCAAVDVGVFEETLDILSVHRQHLQTPALNALAQALTRAALSPTGFPSAVAVVAARQLLARTSVRDHRCDHVLTDTTYQTLHLWPSGHTHAIDVFDSDESKHSKRDRLTGLPLAPAICGHAVDNSSMRALRGKWKRAAASERGPNACCLRCLDFAHKFAETSEDWPGALLNADADAAIADALAVQAVPAVEVGLGVARSLWAIQDALVSAHAAATLTVTSHYLAVAPPWQLWRILGEQAVPTLRALQGDVNAFAGVLSVEEWQETLTAPVDSLSLFRAELAERVLAAYTRN
jgi:hypothetical protein